MIRRLVLLLFVLLVAAGAGAWWMYHRLVTPFQGYAGDEVFVGFPAGTSVSAMAEALAEAGVVRDALTFRVAARMSGQERRLQAGEYRFAGPASSFEVVDKLARGEVYLRPITFREGLTIREMAAHFETMGFGTADAFLEAASRGALVQDLDPDAGNLEGYLFPSTYTLSRSTTAEQLVETMVSTFRAAFTPALRAEAEQGPAAAFDRGEDFHTMLGRLTGNRALSLVHSVVLRLGWQFFAQSAADDPRAQALSQNLPSAVLPAHQGIADALLAGDVELAVARMRSHLAETGPGSEPTGGAG